MVACSIIMVIKDSKEAVFAAVASLLAQSALSELIIVDNGNAPDITARLQQKKLSDPRLQLISGHGDVGYHAGCNIGARAATSEMLLFIKPDYLLSPDAVKLLAEAVQNEPRAMMASGVVRLAGGESGFEFRKKIITPSVILREIVGLDKKNDAAAAEESLTTPYEVATIASACLCIRASDFKKLGGYDDSFYPEAEEFDFCLRAQQIGGRVMCVPQVIITKLPTVSASQKPWETPWQNAQNRLRYVEKFFAGHEPFLKLALVKSLLAAYTWLNMGAAWLKAKRGKNLPHSTAEKRLMALAMGLVDAAGSDMAKGKIVLVTGATGAIGLCVVRRLLASGAAVLAVSRGDGVPFYHKNLRWLKGDLSSPDFSLQGYCIDVVVHAAPLPLLPKLVDLFAESEARRIIAYGSTSVFAKILSANDFERDLALKLQSAEDELAKKCDGRRVSYTIFRPTISYGLGMDAGITKLAGVIRKWGKVLIYPPAFGRRQPVHVDDLAAAAVLAMNNEATYGKSYNLSGGEIISYHDMLARIFEVCGRPQKIIASTMLPFALDVAGWLKKNKYINGEIARRMNDDLVFFNDDAVRDFSYHPRVFLSGGARDIDGF